MDEGWAAALVGPWGIYRPDDGVEQSEPRAFQGLDSRGKRTHEIRNPCSGGEHALSSENAIYEKATEGRLLAYSESRSGIAPPVHTEWSSSGMAGKKNPARLFYGDPILRDALAHVKYSLFYPLKAGFRLAFPYQRNAPFVLLPIFCFAKVRTLGGGEYIIFSFDEEGKPKQ